MTKHKPSKGWIHRTQNCRYICIDGKEMLEHRYIMEYYLKRPLKRNEVVHHINGNRLDNRIKNLQVMTRGEHSTLHNTGKSRKGIRMPPRNKEQIERYRQAAFRRPPMSKETKKKIGESVKKLRAKKFWSSRPREQ